MTLGLPDLVAYSLQLAVLVAAAALMLLAARVTVPHATLRFWQCVLVATVAWPAYQLSVSGHVDPPIISSTLFWPMPEGTAEIRTALGALEGRFAVVIVSLLAAGAIAKLLWIAIGLLELRLMIRRSQPALESLPLAAPLQRELGVSADVRFSDAVTSPATIGARTPIVLLPRRVSELPAPVQRAVLVHELIHVRRRDWIATLVEELWLAVLWFHPAARLLTARLSLARETLVDETTIALTGDRRSYAAALLAFSPAPARLPGAAAFIGRRQLERRIALIAQEVPMTRSFLALRVIIAASVVVAATVMTTSALPIAAVSQGTQKVYRPSEDKSVTLPQVVKEVKPQYTARAMQAKIQGTVWLTVVILTNGDVGDVTVAKSLDAEHGLDDEAVKAARQWKFKPGTKDGKPVPVEVTVEMTFTLKK